MHRPLECSFVALLALSVIGGGDAKEYRKLGAEFVPAESGKRYNEPSCEQLRQMWRFSKRQARASEVTNEIPQYRDPFVYNVWEPYPGTLRSAGARTKSVGSAVSRRQRPVYGKIVHTPPTGRHYDSPQRTRAFDELTARMFGSGRSGGARKTLRYTGADGAMVPQAGSFQHLKDMVRAEREREMQQRFEEAVEEPGPGPMRQPEPLPPANDGAYGSFRYGKQEEPTNVRGVLSFPDLLAPAAGRLDEMGEVGFTSPEEAFGAELFPHLVEEVAPVQLSAKAAKQRSSVTKGQRVYKATPRIKQGSSGESSIYPFASDTSDEPTADEATSSEELEVEAASREAPSPTPCVEVRDRACASSPNCRCVSEVATVSRCFHATPSGPGVCQIFHLDAAESNEFGTWHATPLEPGQLGAWYGQLAPPTSASPLESTDTTPSAASSDRTPT